MPYWKKIFLIFHAFNSLKAHLSPCLLWHKDDLLDILEVRNAQHWDGNYVSSKTLKKVETLSNFPRWARKSEQADIIWDNGPWGQRQIEGLSMIESYVATYAWWISDKDETGHILLPGSQYNKNTIWIEPLTSILTEVWLSESMLSHQHW